MIKIIIPIIIIIIAILLWSIYFPFYREKTITLIPDEDKCFSPECKSIVIKNNNKRAILFIHGFPSTPYMYSWATEYASTYGYDVYAPLIPTFGADYKEFAKTNFSSWFGYIDSYYNKLREEYKELYVIGVSMGGAMTLKLAEEYSGTNKAMDGIAVVSAPVVYNSFIRDRIVTNPLGYIARIIKIFVPYIGARTCTETPEYNDGEENWHGYRGTFPKQGVSLMYNFKIIRKDLNKIKVPMIAIHDETDKTVPYGNLDIIKKETNTKSEFYTSSMGEESINTHHALLTYESTRKPLMDKILSFFDQID